MPSYIPIAKPTTTYSDIGNVAQNFLLINLVDFLLINASGDKLLINETRDSGYASISRPSIPTYTSIAKPA